MVLCVAGVVDIGRCGQQPDSGQSSKVSKVSANQKQQAVAPISPNKYNVGFLNSNTLDKGLDTKLSIMS